LTEWLGSITDTLALTGESAYGNDLEVRLRALTDLAKGGLGLITPGNTILAHERFIVFLT